MRWKQTSISAAWKWAFNGMNAKDENQKKYLAERSKGFGITESAKLAGIGRSTVQGWRKSDTKFKRHDNAIASGAPSEQPDIEPVGLVEFVTSTRYLNKAKTLRPAVEAALEAIEQGDYHTILGGGAIGVGKTTLLQYAFCFELYILSCLDSPHEQFGLDPDTPLILVTQNRTEKLSIQNDFATISAMLMGSQYFKNCFPPVKKPTQNRMHFPARIEVWAESGDYRAILGMNPIVCLLDEVNFMDLVEGSSKTIDGNYDQAAQMYSVARSRQQSRFYLKGKLYSKILIASSANVIGDFTSVVEAEAKSDAGIFVWKKSIWEARPEHYSTETFPVFCGDAARDPYIIRDEEIDPKDRELIIHVPVDFRKDAGRDLYKFLQDAAGIPVRSTAVFFTDRELLNQAFKMDSILSRNSIISGEPVAIVGDRINLSDKGIPRFVHLDLSKTKDSTGFACGFVSHFVKIDRGGVQELLPLIVIEVALQIRPPRHGEIDYSLIRSLIYKLKAHVNITAVRADQFQSTDMLQELARHGFGVSQLSVDRTVDPYLNFKDAIADQRIWLPKNPILQREATNVQIDYKKGKVDHPVNGSKDVLDAVVGVCYALSKDPVQRINHGATAQLAPQVGSVITGWNTTPSELQPFMKDNDSFLRALDEGLNR